MREGDKLRANVSRVRAYYGCLISFVLLSMICPMRNAFATLNRQRRLSTAVHHDRPIGTMLRRSVSLEVQMEIGIGRTPDTWRPSYLLQRNVFSKGFVSVHGERPSAEYAKLRKESLESEFGHIVGTQLQKCVCCLPIWSIFGIVQSSNLFISCIEVDHLAIFFFETLKSVLPRSLKTQWLLIDVGTLGQALNTRPNILPPVYCLELAKLQVQNPLMLMPGPNSPFPTHVAIKSIENELGIPVSEIFADISPEPIAAASIGQVYKAHLHSGELVAVKVQRPGISLLLTLDALLFHMIGGQLKRFAKARKDLLVAVNEMVRHMFDEIDYILEARNAERFASLYSDCPIFCGVQLHKFTSKEQKILRWDYQQNQKCKRNKSAKNIPGSHLKSCAYNGMLTDETALKKACLNQRELIDQGVYCSLRQLLEVGFFHADPHPGNLFATSSGSLAYLDFGMMGDIPRHYRVGLIQVLVHFVNRDSLGFANDFLSLGFIPEGVDIQSVADALQTSFGKGTRQSQDFQSIMNQLYDVIALGSLEVTAKVLYPDFKVVESAYRFVIGKLLADPNFKGTSHLWNRLERLIAAISEQASESSEEPPKSEEKGSHPLGWKSFDMHAVVAATEYLLLFISEKGQIVRVFLLHDIIRAADIFLQYEVMDCRLDAESKARKTSESEDDAIMRRVMNGFGSLKEAVKLGPEVWTPMFIRIALNPQTHRRDIGLDDTAQQQISRHFLGLHVYTNSQGNHLTLHPILLHK
ncbi:hypothetical protein CXB51_012955 [Gossypium anomalum]|uniref:ABC1 atypical kinase-like domain-containing protein n=1 Tax=Gossypium anomalum TaxID=47600 RepID=A0A8J5Z7L4_9ROSI|nr:hypothetical protein CXB51_012955 [Gossypium anomalum]